MNIMIVQKDGNKCKAFKFNERYLQKFLSEVKAANSELKEAWTYSHIEHVKGSSVGIYMNVKQITLL